MKFQVAITVTLRPGIADPQGATIERAMPTLGFEKVSNVHVGKAISFDIEANDASTATNMAEEMCERFLTNPVIEQSHISVTAS